MDGTALCLTPHGRLVIVSDSGAQRLDKRLTERLQEAFARGSGHGLLLLGVDEAGTALPPVFALDASVEAETTVTPCESSMTCT